MTALAAFPPSGPARDGAALRVEPLACGVTRLALNRPQVANAFNPALVRELGAALDDLAGGDVRVLLLEGEGPTFCAGADLASMRDQGQAPMAANLDQALELGRMFERLASFPAPVLAFVRGAAIGGGFGLAACSDFVLAEPGAVFALSEVRIGLVPAVIGPYVVRRLGLAQAAPLMLSGRRLRAPEAQALGLVQRLVGAEETGEAALTGVLRDFLAAGPGAARATKQLLLRIAPPPGAELAGHAARAIAEARASAEGQEGLRAWFGRSAAPWAPPAEPAP